MPSQSLHNQVAIITGASRGIGKAIAIRLAKDGASVVINYSSDSASAEEVVREIGEDRALAVKADVSKVAEIKRLVEETVQKWGKIDILVNSAGIMPMMDLANTTEETYDRTMAVNVKGPYFLTQVDLRHSLTIGSGQTYELRVKSYLVLYIRHRRLHRDTSILAIRRNKRRYRSNGQSARKRPRQTRDKRQRRVSRTYRYRFVPERQK
jgi:NAD(P)-dependent dehydrogenase (short-subunit alcohol dehydrogenase family)